MADKSINSFDTAAKSELGTAKVLGSVGGTTKLMKVGDIPAYNGSCSQAVGGISVGQTFTNASITEIIDALINPYTAPTISLSATNVGTKEQGTSVASVKLTATITKKSKAITRLRFIMGTDTILETVTSGVADGGTFEYTYTPQNPITTNTTFKADVTDGDSTVTSGNQSITFVYPYYYGVTNSDISAAVVTGLTKLVQSKGNKELAYTATAQHGVFAYPKSYGNLAHILDPNGYENISGWTKTEVTINSVDYYVYRSDDALTCSNFKYKFQY
jgi:hypothetical protein